MYNIIGLSQVRKWSEKKKILQGQGKASEFYSESGIIDIIYEEKSGKIEII